MLSSGITVPSVDASTWDLVSSVNVSSSCGSLIGVTSGLSLLTSLIASLCISSWMMDPACSSWETAAEPTSQSNFSGDESVPLRLG